MATQKKRFGGIAGGVIGLILAKGYVRPFLVEELAASSTGSLDDANQTALVAGFLIATAQFVCVAFGYLLGDWLQNSKPYKAPLKPPAP